MPADPDEVASTLRVKRRTLLLAAIGSTAVIGGGQLVAQRLQPTAESELGPEGVLETLVAFTGVLFGRTLSRLEQVDLADRIRYLLDRGGAVAEDCRRLALWIHDQSRQQGEHLFVDCCDEQRDAIVGQLMQINWRTFSARLISRLSADERARYRMRWSAVPQLAWIYRHADAAWRARGYRRWPGLAGDWREALVAGAAYPA